MASLCKKQICTNEKHGIRQDSDSWRCTLIRCVDYKPPSVSNWFDENCLFCCLRREKVKEHVVALNNKIVESGGKPLLGKDHSNIRLEWQVEEFLNAVLHRKEYTPRIPDPHIPVVACDAMQQMIGQLVVHYTSNNSQGSPWHNGNTDQSLLKARSITTPTIAATAVASVQNPVLSKLLMADQDAPLDLSVKKVKPEIAELDGVLDLSIKKNRNQDCMSPKNPHMDFSTAFGTSNCQVSSSVVQEKAQSSGYSEATFEEQPEIQASGETHTLSVAISKPEVHESAFVTSNEFSPAEQPLNPDGSFIPAVNIGPPMDLSKTGIGDDALSPSNTDMNTLSPNIAPYKEAFLHMAKILLLDPVQIKGSHM
ncbi:hypothetical protein P4O66_012651 [Electrophorus voltai]|uniref:Uncharacterized protein n=1 Tax=Electrophorus voltai TaxID=2609070 RepID=A0AAD8Z7E5_9TELE|nr:hypothetical protein P4O66_012651 [Electrophorus voltai]